MSSGRPPNTVVFDQLRQALSDGRYWPGEYLDPVALAQAFDTTPTEVRFALYRLVGAGLLTDAPRQRLRTFVFEQVRRALQCARYRPGERLNPATLAQAFGTSRTLIRLALYRLLGEEVIEQDEARDFHVPLTTEPMLHERYAFMQWCMGLACDMIADPARPESPAITTIEAGTDADVATQTACLFGDIARATGHEPLSSCVGQLGCLLGPVHPAEFALVEDAAAELSVLRRHWQQRDLNALKAALFDYHERRKQLAPGIAALLTEPTVATHD